jgi:glycerol-3-phosphate dehydrogenase
MHTDAHPQAQPDAAGTASTQANAGYPGSDARAAQFARLASTQRFDVAVVGGGATGLGVALDAAARGFSVVLFEGHDFAKGTSSRATKLLHGGVRYLAQGNIALVREALHERTTVLRNAPHLSQALAFVMPSYSWWQTPFYGIGLKMYDLLAGAAGLGKTEFLSKSATLGLLPTANPKGLSGGVKYWDGQFDDARLALALAKTAQARGALVLNYCAVTGLVHEAGRVAGLQVQDAETGNNYTIKARCVVNAAGVWVDKLRQEDGEANARPVKPMVAPSQGVHVVVDREFWPTDHALMVPKTADGRVLFAVPWLGKVILGTTDTPRQDLDREPTAFAAELEFILGEAAKYLTRAPTRALSREHTILVSKSGLLTVTGGKWTTYRAMAEDVLTQAFEANLLPKRPGGVTTHLALFGAQASAVSMSAAPGLHGYGSEAAAVLALPGAQRMLRADGFRATASGLTEAMVRYAARVELARTVEDVLARRSRLLFLDARLAAALAADVAAVLVSETGVDPQLDAFLRLCGQYTLAD